MRHTLLACVLVLFFAAKSSGQVLADPGLGTVSFTTLANAPLSVSALPLSGAFKMSVPFFNKPVLGIPVTIPAGTCRIKIGLGSKAGINLGFDLSTAPYSEYFHWTSIDLGGQIQIEGDLYADLPGDFNGIAVFELKALVVGNSTFTVNFLVSNHNSPITLSDNDPTNNTFSTAYTVIASGTSIAINQGLSITVCQDAALTLTTTSTGTLPFTYLWTSGLGTGASATPPTTSIGSTVYTVTLTDGGSNTANASITVNVTGPSNITASAGANGLISSSGVTSVPCGTGKTYTITPNACYRVADVLVDGVSQGAITTYTFNNVTTTHTISATFALNTFTITVTPGANGTITPVSGAVNCGSNNIYTITPNSCYHIADVKLDGVSQGAVPTLNVNAVSANHTITATFAIDTYNITVTPGANGAISPVSGTVNCGSNNIYTITPDPCYRIVDVKLDGVSQGAVSTLNVNAVSANHTITATFAIDTYNITVTPGANGAISPVSGTVNCGSNNIYTITPDPCYRIVDVKLDGVSQGAVSTLNVNAVSASHTITATFAIDTYTITVTPGANGTITPATGPVNCGSNNTYTITPNACYHIADVKLDGVSQGAVPTLNVNAVSASHTITATFAIDTYIITVTPGANGTITPATGPVNCGSNNTYTITPNACYHIADVKLDGVSQGAVSTLNVNAVSASHTITATFAIDIYTITVTPGANGTITPGTGTVNCGSNNTYTITPNACYHIADVKLDGVSQGAVPTLNVNAVSANHTITATFAIDTYIITVTPGANGTITPATGPVNCGSNNTYTITPNACYHIADVKLDGVSQGAVPTLNVNAVSASHTITATFAIDIYTITVTPGANGTITPGTGTVNCGSNNVYTITPNACYHIADVKLDGVSQGAVPTLNVNAVSASHTITATFAIDTYIITVTPGANGTITPATGPVNCGSNNTYTITPNACYHIADVKLDGVSQGAVPTLNVNAVSASHTITATFAIDIYTITVTPGANGTITPGTGTVNCGSNNVYTITPNACYHIADVKLDGVSQGAVPTLNVNAVSANHTITATFAIDTYIITVTPGANGTITPATGPVNCGSNNTYTITPNACYHIADVKLDGVSQGAVPTLNVNAVSASHTITATFAIDTYIITVTPGANGTITPATGPVNCGSNNTYTITPNACYHIADVKLDGVSQGAVPTLNVNAVSANHTITATFAIDTYIITVTPGANGTITPATGTVNCGSNNTYTITPNACYHIADVKLDGVSQGAVPTLNVNAVSANHTITATFAIDTYIITVTPGANGTITPVTGPVNCGSNNVYTITPNACYHIADVKLDGVSQGAVPTLNVNAVSASHTITATFAIDTYIITVTPGANGTITPATGTVNCGSNNLYTITADPCYRIVDVKLDGVSQGAVPTLNVNAVSASHTITATFAIDTYIITVTPGANGTITPATGPVNCGSNNTYTITPNACYHIVDVKLDGVSQGTLTSLDVNNVTADHTITATFAINNIPVPTITVVDNCNGTSTLTASGYTGTLSWSDGGTDNPHIVNLPGNYTVTQTIGSCTSDPGLPATATPGTAPAVPLISILQPDCTTSTGTIIITTITGLHYSINGSDYTNTNGIFPGLAQGSYNVTAKTNDDCISNITIAVINSQPTQASLSVNAIQDNSCHGGSSGKITVTGGGASGYTYTIVSGSTINTTGQSSGIFTGLSAGSYVISVSAVGVCPNTATAPVTEPPGIYTDLSLGSDLSSNFFFAVGAENILLYNVSEVGGNPAVGDTMRITRVPGYSLSFDDNAASIVMGGTTYTLDNQRWKVDDLNPAFVAIIFDPENNSTPGTLNCSEFIRLALRFKRNTPNISTFSLTARFRKANNEDKLVNNLNSLLFTAE